MANTNATTSIRLGSIALALMLEACLAAGGNAPNNKGDSPKTAADPPGAPATGSMSAALNAGRLRRLSHREYNSVVRDLLGDLTRPADRFIEESYTNGYDNGSEGLAVQFDLAAQYQAAAEALAHTALISQRSMLLEGCDPVAAGEAACKAAFFSRFPARAFRRIPTDTELQRLEAVYTAGAAAGGFNSGIEATVSAILQSPGFLYREELGTPAKGGGMALTSYEIASEISFFLTGSMPDPKLLDAVAEGRLHTRADLEREARRLLETPKARANLAAFFNTWLATDRLTRLTKDPDVYPQFNEQMRASMTKEIDRFIGDVIWNGSSTLRELFSSNAGYVDGALASIYGAEAPAGAPGSDLSPTALDPNQRKGILTRAGFLAVHSAPDISAPVERGVFLRQAILCAPLPPPPPDVLQRFRMETPPPNQTTRERFAQHTSDPACSGCHQFIDGIGFGFEQFDAIGRLRTEEHGSPVDTRGILKGTDNDGPFEGGSELSMRLLSSRDFESCFVRQMFRFAMGRTESADDRSTLSSWSDAFSVDQPVTNLLVSIATDPAFLTRNQGRN